MINFLITFSLILIINILVYLYQKKDIKKAKELKLLLRMHNLKQKDINLKKTLITLKVINTFIMSFTISIAYLIDGYVWQLLSSFVILLILIYVFYTIYGKTIIRKVKQNGKHK